MKLSPTARTLRYCKDLGWTAQRTEQWIHFASRELAGRPPTSGGLMRGVRRDLFGFIDVLAIAHDDEVTGLIGPFVLAIQVTSLAHMAGRAEKARALPTITKLQLAGVRCEVWGWGPSVRGSARARLVRVNLREPDVRHEIDLGVSARSRPAALEEAVG